MKQRLWVAAGLSYASLAATHFGVLLEAREALQDVAADVLPAYWSEKFRELSECPFCASFWLALIVTRGRPIKALQLAGMAMPFTAATLAVTD